MTAIIAILGAESTGKTTLAEQLATALRREGRRVAVVAEYLREFCDTEGRTPRRDEQILIAQEHTRRVRGLAAQHDLVITDTTALQTAVYSEQVFGDRSLYADAERWQRLARLTLLTALDLPWRPDGLQRDGPHVRAPVDTLLRAALQRAEVAYAVIQGQGPERLARALSAVRRALAAPEPADGEPTETAARWHWRCERCGDAQCEQHLFISR